MKIYMSLLGRYTTPEKASEMKRMANLSFLLAKKHYGEVHLLGDKKGIALLKHLDWSSVSDELEELPDGYKTVWSLSKLKAYNIIAQKKEPFFHIDFDFFFIKKLPNELETAPVLFHFKERGLNRGLDYHTDIFHKDIKFLPLKRGSSSKGSDIEPSLEAYNCGIVGGLDVKFLELYSSLAIECVLSEENKQFWHNETFRPITKATLAEQYYPCLVARHNRPRGYVKFIEDRGFRPPVDLSLPVIHLLGGSKPKIGKLETAILNSEDHKDIAEKFLDYQREL